MSTLSVTTVTSANGTTDLTLNNANNLAGDIIIPSTGGVVIGSNSTVNNIIVTTAGTVIASNSTVDVITVQANSGLVLRPNNVLGTVGQVLVSNSIGGVFFQNATKIAVKETVFVANGTFTKDANLVSLMVYCVGSGGGGGGSNSAATATGAKGGAGGGGGGCAVKVLQNSEVGATSNVVVGIGGAGGANATVSTGGTGSNSTFANSTGGLIIGVGGSGGTNTVSGAGGSASGGDINISGADGSLGSGASGSFNQGIGGGGGHAALGFGHGGNMLTGSAVGVNGDLYGGGGSGSSSANSGTTSRAGGAGANGVVWVIEYYHTLV